MSVKTIADRWEDFRARVISPVAPAIQVSEMRMAFYAGFKAMLDAELEIADLDSQTAGVAILHALHEEAITFGRSYRSPREKQ